jgi:hypothetical protein
MGTVYKAESRDGGRTWSKSSSLGVEAPESCPELCKVPKTGNLLLIWNGSKYDPKWASHFGKRTPLSAFATKGRGIGGVRAIKTNSKTGPVAAARVVLGYEELMMISAGGMVVVALENRLHVRSLKRENRELKAENQSRYSFIGDSAPMRELYGEPLRHTAGYAAVMRNAVNLDNYEAQTELFPIMFRPDRNPAAFVGAMEENPPRVRLDSPLIESVLLWDPQRAAPLPRPRC